VLGQRASNLKNLSAIKTKTSELWLASLRVRQPNSASREPIKLAEICRNETQAKTKICRRQKSLPASECQAAGKKLKSSATLAAKNTVKSKTQRVA